jgi:hypothetical protein
MKVKIVYDDGQSSSVFQHANPQFKLRVKLNKMPYQDYLFSQSSSIYIEDAQINKEKVNVLKFREVKPDEKEEAKRNILINIFKGIGFVLMYIFLPFAVMRFNRVNQPFFKVKFAYSETNEFILAVSKIGYATKYEQEIIPEPVFDGFETQAENA